MAQNNNEATFALCPFCRAYPSVREATEQERRFSAARHFRLSHQCADVNCLLYGRSMQDLSYEWSRFIATPKKRIL